MAVRKPTPNWLKKYVDPQVADLAVPQTAITITQAALTDSSGGTASQTLAATAGISQISFYVPLTSMADADIITDFVPGFKFKLLALDFVTIVPATTASKASTLHLEIGSTAVGAGTCALTTVGCNARGKLTAGAAITGANTGSESDAISVVGASTTTFGEGAGNIVITIQNMDVADAVASIAREVNKGIIDLAALEALLDAAGVST